MWYNEEIVSINLDTKFYCIRYTDKDKGDITAVVDVRRYLVAKEVYKKKQGSTKRQTKKNMHSKSK